MGELQAVENWDSVPLTSPGPWMLLLSLMSLQKKADKGSRTDLLMRFPVLPATAVTAAAQVI